MDFHPEGMAVEEITVARMRDWWAEETGEEQLAHYSIHAKANPEDRWYVPCHRHCCVLLYDNETSVA